MLTLKYVSAVAHDGREITLTGADQSEIEAKLGPVLAREAIVQGEVFDAAGLKIAQWTADRSGFRPIPGTTGWVDEDQRTFAEEAERQQDA